MRRREPASAPEPAPAEAPRPFPPPLQVSEGGGPESDREMRPLRILLWATGAALFLMVGGSLWGNALSTGGLGSASVSPDWQVPGGDEDRGREAIIHYNCSTCHTISGVRDANARVGPILTGYATQGYIAGRLTNAPFNLVQWVQDPQRFEPGSAMPNLGVTERDARDIAAYLYSKNNK